MILFLVLASTQSQAELTSFSYSDAKTEIENSLKIAAQAKPLADVADQTLSKLILAKSDAITRWVNLPEHQEMSDAEIVRKWREYFLSSIVLTSPSHPDRGVQQQVRGLFKEISRRTFPYSVRSQIRKQFEYWKKFALQRVDQFNLDRGTKTSLKARLRETRLIFLEDLNYGSPREDKVPAEFLFDGLAYHPLSNSIQVGVQTLKYVDPESLGPALIHEMAHSFDACRWQAFLSKVENPFTPIFECLRSDESVGAKKRDDSDLEDFEKEGKLTSDEVKALKLNPTCNLKSYPAGDLQRDQLNEVFADWFSADVLALDPKFKNRVRPDLLEKIDLPKGSSYIANEDRLNRIYLGQPELRKRFLPENSDSKAPKYCSF